MQGKRLQGTTQPAATRFDLAEWYMAQPEDHKPLAGELAQTVHNWMQDHPLREDLFAIKELLMSLGRHLETIDGIGEYRRDN